MACVISDRKLSVKARLIEMGKAAERFDEAEKHTEMAIGGTGGGQSAAPPGYNPNQLSGLY
jgi:hypothetical protein